jgi:hypothetical protein
MAAGTRTKTRKVSPSHTPRSALMIMREVMSAPGIMTIQPGTGNLVPYSFGSCSAAGPGRRPMTARSAHGQRHQRALPHFSSASRFTAGAFTAPQRPGGAPARIPSANPKPGSITPARSPLRPLDDACGWGRARRTTLTHFAFRISIRHVRGSRRARRQGPCDGAGRGARNCVCRFPSAARGHAAARHEPASETELCGKLHLSENPRPPLLCRDRHCGRASGAGVVA